MRYFLLDKITELETGKRACGVKCVTFSDETLHDHFPGHPILPGALLLEGLAQLAGFLVECSFNQDESRPVARAVLASVEKMKFYKFSTPGDRLEYRAEIESLLEDAASVSVLASCDGERRAQGKLAFVLIPIDSPQVTAQRLETYRTWTRELKAPPRFR